MLAIEGSRCAASRRDVVCKEPEEQSQEAWELGFAGRRSEGSMAVRMKSRVLVVFALIRQQSSNTAAGGRGFAFIASSLGHVLARLERWCRFLVGWAPSTHRGRAS